MSSRVNRTLVSIIFCWYLLCFVYFLYDIFFLLLYFVSIFFFFFFFQAEDGIRDRNVTEVQTCALPIWFLRSAGHHPCDPGGGKQRQHHDEDDDPADHRCDERDDDRAPCVRIIEHLTHGDHADHEAPDADRQRNERAEEWNDRQHIEHAG